MKKIDLSSVKFDMKKINPLYVLDAVLALLCVVLFFSETQTLTPIFLELGIVGCAIAGHVLIAGKQALINSDQVTKYAAIVVAASSYIDDGLAKLKLASQNRILESARSGLMLMREGLVQSPAQLGDFVAVLLSSVTGTPETIDAHRLASWPDFDSLDLTTLTAFEATWTNLRDHAIYLLRAVAGIGVDRKTVEERRAAFAKDLEDLRKFGQQGRPAQVLPVSTTT
jgi:hypothetical protein